MHLNVAQAASNAGRSMCMAITADKLIVTAIEHFFKYGLNPGSCATALLQLDYDRAYLCAHKLIRPDDIWQEHIQFLIDCVPSCCKGNNYNSWQGYSYMTDKEKAEVDLLITLSVKYPAIVCRWVNQTHNEFII